MGSLITLIVIVSLSLLITRIAAIMLSHTGLSKESANFQARSAFTGVGFTTREAESVVGHPVRRRIIKGLMLIGNVGVISAIASLILTFVGNNPQGVKAIWKLAILLGAFGILWLLSSSRHLEKYLEKIVNKALKKYTDLNIKDYASLLHLSGDYEIHELDVSDDDWMADKTLREIDLRSEGINILGIRKSNGDYVGVPNAETRIDIDDRLILYGREESIKELNKRKKGKEGEKGHEKAQIRQEEENKKQLEEQAERENASE